MNVEITGGDVSFIVNYDLFVYKKKENTSTMETYDVKTDVKG